MFPKRLIAGLAHDDNASRLPVGNNGWEGQTAPAVTGVTRFGYVPLWTEAGHLVFRRCFKRALADGLIVLRKDKKRIPHRTYTGLSLCRELRVGFFCPRPIHLAGFGLRLNLNQYSTKQMTNRKKEYLKYLESAHWKALRHAAKERDGYRCCRCGSHRKIQGHHKKYRKDLRLCTVEDIETLCDKCHRRHHKKVRKERRKARAMTHLVRLIGAFSAR